jgi:hypothetical protein
MDIKSFERIKMYDNILSDFLKFDLDKSDSERIQRAIDATENGILYIPKGDYSIKTPLLIKNRCSLKMHPAARLVAEQEMDFVLTYKPDGAYHKLTMFNDDGSVYDNLGLFIEGGDIDGNGKASCFAITNAHHFTISNISLHNGKEYGMYIGGKNEGHIYELVCNNVYCKCTMKGLSGNVGIWSDKCDSHFNDCFVIDYTVGMRMLGAANRISRCHLWGGTVPPKNYSVEEWSDIYGKRKLDLVNGVYGDDALDTDYENEVPEMLIDSIAFDIRANCNVLDGCYADTAAIGYNIAGDTRLIGCDFFNNKLMGMKNSLAINHESGKLQVHMTTFRATAGREVLYLGNKDDVDWSMNNVSGFSENVFDK